MAEREGFEPPIRLPVCRISSAVHSTTLPPLHRTTIYHEIDHGPAESGCRVRIVAVAAMYARPQFRAPRYSTPGDASSRRVAISLVGVSELLGVGAGSPIGVPSGWTAPESGSPPPGEMLALALIGGSSRPIDGRITAWNVSSLVWSKILNAADWTAANSAKPSRLPPSFTARAMPPTPRR